MQKEPTSSSRPLKRYLLAISGVLLALSGQETWAQTAEPKPAWAWVRPGTLFYLDGKPSTLAEVQRVEDDAIYMAEGIELFGKDSANQPFGNSIAPAAEIITTKANATSPAVLALADRLGLRSGYTEKPATMGAVAPKALAYVTGHYPQHWLGGEVLERTQKSTGAVRYQVQLANRWGWRYVDFTPEGKVIENPLASPIATLLVLTLSYPHAALQPTPATGRQDALVYLDGQRIGPTALRALSPDSVARVVELRGEASQLLTPEATALNSLIITTTRKQAQPATIAFNTRVQQLEVIQQLAGHSHKAWAATPALPNPQPGAAGEIRYYLNDKPIAGAILEKLDQNNIAGVEVVRGDAAADYAHDAAVSGVVLIQTKQLPQPRTGNLRVK